MNHLLAEIIEKKRGVKTFKVFSEEEVYALPNDLDNPKDYNSDYNLEDDEWFYIPNFSTTKFCIPLLIKDFISTDYNQISTEQLKKMKYLCSYQIHDNKEYYYFQKISASQVIEKRWFKFSDAPSLEKNSSLVVINVLADAIYLKTEDFLYFKKLTSISSIFKGISELYKEATQEETKNFLESDFIKLEDNYSADKVGASNRKRIAMALDTLSTFTVEEKTHIYSYIKEYCNKLNFDEIDSNFTIKSEDDLKHLLWGIEQRYYTTPIRNEKRVANSVSAV